MFKFNQKFTRVNFKLNTLFFSTAFILCSGSTFATIENPDHFPDKFNEHVLNIQNLKKTDPKAVASFDEIEKLAKFLVTDTSTLKADATLVIYTRSKYYPIESNSHWKDQLKAAALLMDLPIKKARTQSAEGELAAIDLVFASVVQEPSTHPAVKSFISTFHKDLVSRMPVLEQMQYGVASSTKMIREAYDKVSFNLKAVSPMDWNNQKIDSIKTANGMPISYYQWVNSILALSPSEKSEDANSEQPELENIQ